jgi:hypothetical protein
LAAPDALLTCVVEQWLSSRAHRPVPFEVGLSVAMRITSLRIAASVEGRPGRRRLV